MRKRIFISVRECSCRRGLPILGPFTVRADEVIWDIVLKLRGVHSETKTVIADDIVWSTWCFSATHYTVDGVLFAISLYLCEFVQGFVG